MSETTRKALRRRLKLTLRYHAWLCHDATPKERGEYVIKPLCWCAFLVCGGFLLAGAVALNDRCSRQGRVGSIYIIDTESESGPTFGRVTTEALQLIARTDPRRYRRIQREVRVIKNRPMTSLGVYHRDERKCEIHFSRIPAPRPDLADRDYHFCLAYYAALLIHEATHGHFYSLGIPYTTKTRADIERLCVQEAHRFALRLFGGDSQRADKLIPPFDAKRWEPYWRQSSWQVANANWAAAKKERQEREAQRKSK